MIIADHAGFGRASPLPLAEGRSAPGGHAELHLVRASDLSPADHARWDDLGSDPAATSVFAEPWFTRASLAHCPGGSHALLAIVGDRSGDWLGAMPLVPRLVYGRAPFPHWAAWSHPNQFRGTPLVRRGEALRFWQGLLAGLDRGSFGRLALRLARLPLEDDVTRALFQLCRDERRPCKVDSRYQRAVLHAGHPGDPDPLKGSRRRRIASLERKAERELGPLAWRVARTETALGPALDRLLALEEAGWKGKAGSALASSNSTRGFFAAVTGAAAGLGRLEVTELLAGDCLLAASAHFTGGDEGFGYKMAYDEALSAFGPGLLLLNRLTAHFRETGPARIDSCSAPGQEPIGSLWPDRMELVDCGVALGRGLRRQGLDLLDLAETIYRGQPA